MIKKIGIILLILCFCVFGSVYVIRQKTRKIPTDWKIDTREDRRAPVSQEPVSSSDDTTNNRKPVSSSDNTTESTVSNQKKINSTTTETKVKSHTSENTTHHRTNRPSHRNNKPKRKRK